MLLRALWWSLGLLFGTLGGLFGALLLLFGLAGGIPRAIRTGEKNESLGRYILWGEDTFVKSNPWAEASVGLFLSLLVSWASSSFDPTSKSFDLTSKS